MQIWDTAGSEKYHAIGSNFYRSSQTCVLVFDLTNKESFQNIETWRKEFLENMNPDEGPMYPFVLLGNKNDMKEDCQVNAEDIQNYCNDHNNMPYFSVSAKDNDNVEQAFKKVADLAYERHKKSSGDIIIPEIKPLVIEKVEEPKKGCCLKSK